LKIICFDPGTVRIGAAISDESEFISRPLGFIKNDERLERLLKELAIKEHFDRIIVGNPLNMDGTKNPRTTHGDILAEKLGKIFPAIPLEMWDERLSTADAEEIMIRANVSRKKRKKKIDSLAAALILQSYLDSRGRRK
jgi:putative Holliday junction resolvase